LLLADPFGKRPSRRGSSKFWTSDENRRAKDGMSESFGWMVAMLPDPFREMVA